jgi:hypothetical protein
MTFVLGRRTLLRGLGVGIALPTLDAMLNDRGLVHGQAWGAAFPQRLLTYFIPNGMPVMEGRDHSRWEPKVQGRGYDITPCLKPIETFRDDFNVISGLPLGIAQNVGNGHARGGGAFATGVDITVQGATGPSIDQIAAKMKGDATKLRSLVIDVQNRFTSDCGREAVSNCYNISWTGALQPVPADSDPIKLYAKLFGAGIPAASGATSMDPQISHVLKQRQSVIDFVKADLSRLNARVGTSDKGRLDAHLTAIREIERQLTANAVSGGASCKPGMAPTAASIGPTATGGYSPNGAKLLMSLLALAFKCDLTRYASFRLGQAGAGNGPSDPKFAPGASRQQHDAAHARDMGSLQAYTVAHMTMFNHLLTELKGNDTTREGTGYVLDNSIIYLGSEMFDGSTHANNLQPVVLAGRAGGQHVTGRHMLFPKGSGKSVGNMLLAMLKFAGIPVTNLGKHVEPLPGLTTG